MISDVLFDAVSDIRSYLSGEMYKEPALRARIERLVADMDAMRAALDEPPTDEGGPEHDLRNLRKIPKGNW